MHSPVVLALARLATPRPVHRSAPALDPPTGLGMRHERPRSGRDRQDEAQHDSRRRHVVRSAGGGLFRVEDDHLG